MKTASDKLNGISTEAVNKATGKSWAQWLKALDAAGCKTLVHRQIVDVVKQKFGLGPWWQQMVTVGYEQARGRRVKHQTASGYSVNVNKTFGLAADALFAAWTEPKMLKRWMSGDAFEITTATPRKSVRLKCSKDGSRVCVMLYPKGAGKTQMSVEHAKLSSVAAVQRMRKFWKGKIAKLEEAFDV